MFGIPLHKFEPKSVVPKEREAEQALYDRLRAEGCWAQSQPEFRAAAEVYDALVREESVRVRAQAAPNDPVAFAQHVENGIAHRERMLVADVRQAEVYAALIECWNYAHDAVHLREHVKWVRAGEPKGVEIKLDFAAVDREARRLFDLVRKRA